MLEILNSIDTEIFLFLNGLHASFLDNFMFAFSGKWIWIPFYAAILFRIARTWRKESIWIILAIVLCIALADQLASGLIKDWVQRPRPSQEANLEGLVHIVNGYRGGRFGFVSSHAANAFGLALFCSLLFRRTHYTWTLFLWAAAVAYSRIYLGVHYPGDIVGGTLVGLFSAGLCFFLLKKFRPQALNPALDENRKLQTSFLRRQLHNLPLWALLLIILSIAVYSFCLFL